MQSYSKRNFLDGKNHGFTIVEVLVSSIILAIAIAALVVVLQKGSEFNASDMHRRRARMIADSVFECNTYQYANYAALATGTLGSPITITLGSTDPLHPFSPSATITITKINANAPMPEYLEMTVHVGWTEAHGQAESVDIKRRISEL